MSKRVKIHNYIKCPECRKLAYTEVLVAAKKATTLVQCFHCDSQFLACASVTVVPVRVEDQRVRTGKLKRSAPPPASRSGDNVFARTWGLSALLPPSAG
jgi:hypothetical protein